MVTLDKIKGLTVEVQVAGVALPEFPNDKHSTHAHVSKYIEARTGAQFVVVCKVDEDSDLSNKSLVFKLHVDDEEVGGRVMGCQTAKAARTITFRGPDDHCGLRFMFAALRTSKFYTLTSR